MKREEKQQMVESLQSEFEAIRHAVVVGYRGISVPQVTELRAQVRGAGARYRVIKNRLLKRAVASAPLGKLSEHLSGPTAVVWSDEEPVAMAKTLTQFAKQAPVLEFKAVLVDGEAVPVAELDAIASLPSVEELRARVVTALASPLTRTVSALSGPARNLLSVLQQKADKEE